MIAPLAKYFDWWALQLLGLRWQAWDGGNPRLEEALEFLNGPDFLPAESQPARLEFGSPLHFRFPSPRRSSFAENNITYGRFYRCAGRWQERPVIILLHGGVDFFNHWFRYPLIARHCNRARINAATLMAPLHFKRRQRRPGSLDYLEWAEAAAQAVAEIRALIGWLLAEGCPAVALWGYSMGGWFAGMTACRDARLAAAVLTAPAVRMNYPMARLVLRRNIPKAMSGQIAEYETLNQTAWNLTRRPLTISKERILLVEAIHDLLATKESVEELWQAWGRPEIWRLPHGHATWMGVPGFTGRILRWLTPRLEVLQSTTM